MRSAWKGTGLDPSEADRDKMVKSEIFNGKLDASARDPDKWEKARFISGTKGPMSVRELVPDADWSFLDGNTQSEPDDTPLGLYVRDVLRATEQYNLLLQILHDKYVKDSTFDRYDAKNRRSVCILKRIVCANLAYEQKRAQICRKAGHF